VKAAQVQHKKLHKPAAQRTAQRAFMSLHGSEIKPVDQLKCADGTISNARTGCADHGGVAH
jgi:hypothetical protein